MSLNNRTTAGINPVLASRLKITNTILPAAAGPTVVTLTVSEVLGGLLTGAIGLRDDNMTLNLPTPAIFIGSQTLNGVQVGDTFPLIVRNQDNTVGATITLTPTGIAVMNPVGGGVVAITTNRSYVIRIDTVTPGTEDYTVFDVTDTGLQI
ncbi:unnamed protein product [marine sediment metagenome]|uniref:Uncharacterized protein n=1 Tax=marine sediment metagenome TaxID=412755 RepID=X0U5L4_9ZZZZ